jgi:hypothetical protein
MYKFTVTEYKGGGPQGVKEHCFSNNNPSKDYADSVALFKQLSQEERQAWFTIEVEGALLYVPIDKVRAPAVLTLVAGILEAHLAQNN